MEHDNPNDKLIPVFVGDIIEWIYITDYYANYLTKRRQENGTTTTDDGDAE